MEKELLKEYKPVLARSGELEDTQYQPIEQADVKEIIHDVLQSVQGIPCSKKWYKEGLIHHRLL